MIGGTTGTSMEPLRIRSVTRCLFGPPDPLAAQFAREKVKEIREQDKRRYNFDFDKEEPMEGPFKWEAVPVAPPTPSTSSSMDSSSSGSEFAPKAYALSRLPYLSGSMVQMDRDRSSVPRPPLRTTINNNQLPPSTSDLYFQPERDSLFIVRTISGGGEEERRPRSISSITVTAATATATKTSVSQSTLTTTTFVRSSTITSPTATVVIDTPTIAPTMLSVLPSPETSSCCSSEDSANILDMETGEDEEEEDLSSSSPTSTEGVSQSTTNTKTATSKIATSLSSSSGLSSSISSSSSSSNSSPTSRRTKSVSSSSPSPSASPSSPSTQPPITKFLPVRKRSASTTTQKAASESAPISSAANMEKKRAY